MRKNKALKVIGIVTMVVALLSGLFLMGVDLIKNQIRQQIKISAIEAVESAIDDGGGEVEIEIPITDFLKVNGESGEDDTTIQELVNEMSDISAEHENLKLLGILEIPCIDLKEPIWDSCSSTALRYGVGRFPQTCGIGEEGNCMLFGHRMESHTIFWNLQDLENYIGEEVIVTTTDGIQHKYVIEDTTYVKDSELDPFLRSDKYNSKHLCLATCGYGQDPNNKNVYRPRNTEFIVICVPENGGKNESNYENRQNIQDGLQLHYRSYDCRAFRSPMLRGR